MRFCAKKSFDPRVKAFLSSVCRCPLPFFPNLRINALPAAVMRCVRNFDYPFAAADKFFYQKRRNNLVVAADIMSLRNFRELFPITFQIKRFIQRRNFLVLCPGQMVEVAGNGYDFLNVEARFGGGNKPRRLGAAGKTDQNDRRIAGNLPYGVIFRIDDFRRKAGGCSMTFAADFTFYILTGA